MLHTDLDVYKKSMTLVKGIYQLTRQFPSEEIYGLTSQMRRSAVSIPSNTAEGCGRSSPKELRNFLNIALGSLAELGTQLDISAMLGYVNDNDTVSDIKSQLIGIRRMLLGLRRSITN